MCHLQQDKRKKSRKQALNVVVIPVDAVIPSPVVDSEIKVHEKYIHYSHSLYAYCYVLLLYFPL